MAESYDVKRIQLLAAFPENPENKTLYLTKNGSSGFNAQMRKLNSDVVATLNRKVRLSGPREIYPANGVFGQATYLIKNFSVFEQYAVSISAGSVSRVGDTITVTPPQTAQDIYLTVNNESSLIRVRPHGVRTPDVIYPSAGNSVVQMNFTAIASVFNLTSGVDTCTGIEFQVSPSGDFVSDVQTFTASGSTDRANIALSSTYMQAAIRARYIGAVFGASPWSEPVLIKVINNTAGFQEQASIKKFGDTASSDFSRVVSTSGEGEVILVCSPWAQYGKGSADIYSMISGMWLKVKELKAPIGNTNDGFGKSGQVSTDGLSIVIGAPGTNANDGMVYLARKVGGVWGDPIAIEPPIPGQAGAFGNSVSISGDGSVIAVGEDYGTGAISASGVVRLYSVENGIATYVNTLSPSDLSTNDLFGHDIALSSSGTVLAIGAPYQANVETFSGSVYIYEKVNGSWTLRTKITPDPEVESGMFGYQLAISADGGVVAVSRLGVITSGGAAYFFHRSGNTWFQAQILQPADAAIGDNFGTSITLSGAGDVCVIGCSSRSSNQGKAYVAKKVGGVWSVDQMLEEAIPAINNKFARAVSISANAVSLVIGSQGHDQEPGTVYIYE